MAKTNIIETIMCALCKKIAESTGIYDSDIQGQICRECVMPMIAAQKYLRAEGFTACTHDPAHER